MNIPESTVLEFMRECGLWVGKGKSKREQSDNFLLWNRKAQPYLVDRKIMFHKWYQVGLAAVKAGADTARVLELVERYAHEDG